MSRADTQFSKVRLETLRDGIFAIAMTLFAAAMTQTAIALTNRRLAARR